MHYVIFIPAATGYNAADQLESVGLGSLVDKYVGPASENCTLGEQEGRLIRFDDVSRPEHNATPGVDDKTWWWDHKRRYAIGYVAESPPCPEDLQRTHRFVDDPLLTSFPCRLQGEQIWLVPIARQVPREWSQCPETGMPTLAAKPAFAWYFDEARELLSQISGGQIVPDAMPAYCFDFAIRALALNYRICPEVAHAIHLFDQADAGRVIGAACEFSVEFEATLQWGVRASNPILDQKKNGQPSLDDRYLIHQRWKNGLSPSYAPALLDYLLLESSNG